MNKDLDRYPECSLSAMKCEDFARDMNAEDVDSLVYDDSTGEPNLDLLSTVEVPKFNLRILWKEIFQELDDYIEGCTLTEGYVPIVICEDKDDSLFEICRWTVDKLKIFARLGLLKDKENLGDLIVQYVGSKPDEYQEIFYRSLAIQEESGKLLRYADESECWEDFFEKAGYYSEKKDPRAAEAAFELWKDVVEVVDSFYSDDCF